MKKDINKIFQDYLASSDERVSINFLPLLEQNPDIGEELSKKIEAYEKAVGVFKDKNSKKIDKNDPLIGTSLGGCKIINIISHGGMSVVYLAKQESLDREVAVKVLDSVFTKNESSLGRFRRESKNIAKLNHDNILPVYEFGEQNGYNFVITSYVKGISLEKVIKLFEDSKAPPSLDSIESLFDNSEPINIKNNFKDYYDFVWKTIIKVGKALNYAHKNGIVHRDVKPSNIIVRSDGKPVLIDFGLSRDFNDMGMTLTGEYLGTPVYSSPEQLFGEQSEIDASSDVYSLGVTFYELLTGNLPYSGKSFLDIVTNIKSNEPVVHHSINPEIKRILNLALSKRKDTRYSSVADFLEDLEKVDSADVGYKGIFFVCPHCDEKIDAKADICPYCKENVGSEELAEKSDKKNLEKDCDSVRDKWLRRRSFLTISVSIIVTVVVSSIYFLYFQSNQNNKSNVSVLVNDRYSDTKSSVTSFKCGKYDVSDEGDGFAINYEDSSYNIRKNGFSNINDSGGIYSLKCTSIGDDEQWLEFVYFSGGAHCCSIALWVPSDSSKNTLYYFVGDGDPPEGGLTTKSYNNKQYVEGFNYWSYFWGSYASGGPALPLDICYDSGKDLLYDCTTLVSPNGIQEVMARPAYPGGIDNKKVELYALQYIYNSYFDNQLLRRIELEDSNNFSFKNVNLGSEILLYLSRRRDLLGVVTEKPKTVLSYLGSGFDNLKGVVKPVYKFSNTENIVQTYFKNLNLSKYQDALNLIVKEKRDKGNYTYANYSEYYGSFLTPIKLKHWIDGPDGVYAFYNYKNADGKDCQGRSKINTSTEAGEIKISRIKNIATDCY